MAAVARTADAGTSTDSHRRHEPGEDRPVDLVHLARYTTGNRSLEREILRLFRCQSELYVERLRDADGPAAWQDAVHTLKGSARGIGAWKVAEYAEKAETLAREHRGDDAAAAVDAIAAQVAEANRFIRYILGGG